MADVKIRNLVKIYPYIDKKPKKGEKVKKTNLQITDKGVVAVQKFNLDIKHGEFVVLVGPSGCGKSTTLRMIAGLEDISEGDLYIDGKLMNAVEPKDRDIAMVFQSYALYPHMTVFQNMAYPLRILPQHITYKFEIRYLNNKLEKIAHIEEELKEKYSNKPEKLQKKLEKYELVKKEAEARITECNGLIDKGEESYFKKMSKDMIDFKVREIAEMLNISEYLDRKPKNLSGGQRQRVAIGRAIVRNPKVLLMDEPLSNLDAKLRNQMRAEIIKIRQRIQTTFIYVTHDQIEAMTLGDRIVVMKDGYIQQVGTPQEVFDHPRNLFVSGFIGIPQMNYFDAKLLKKEDGYYVDINGYVVKPSKEKQERLKKSKVEEQDILVGVRPDHMSITDKGITGRVNVTELMGTTSHIHATVNNKDIIAIVPNDGVHVDYINKDVTFGFNGNVIHMFSKENERNLEFLSEVLASEFRSDDDLAKKQAEHEKK